jgi:BirA family biotin operon repressor/biotin-[acetyl-CoA-carboxylase] ligase
MTQLTGSYTIFLEETSSTNEALKIEELNKKLPEGAVLYTNFQSKGKGQQEAKWESEPHKNILLSVLYYPVFLKPEEQMWLNMAISLACKKFLSQLIPENEVFIKWPNDLVCEGKKLGGILIENSLQGAKIRSSIVGIGINVNQTEFTIEKAGSISQITNKELNIKELRQSLFLCLDEYYSLLKAKQFSSIKSQYESYLLFKGKEALFLIDGNEVLATVLGIGNYGKLHLLINDEIKSFANKEIVFCNLS